MSERISKSMLMRKFQYLLKLLGKEWGIKVGDWNLNYISIYGGWVIEEVINPGGAVRQPFGAGRQSTKEFYNFLTGVIEGINLVKESK
jgi:hypothetical protein